MSRYKDTHNRTISQIPQCPWSISHNAQLKMSGALWDMGQVHCGICELGQLYSTKALYRPFLFHKTNVRHVYSIYVHMEKFCFVVVICHIFIPSLQNCFTSTGAIVRKVWKKQVPWWQGSWGQHGAHLGPVVPRWAPCRPHEPCYLGQHQTTARHNKARTVCIFSGMEFVYKDIDTNTYTRARAISTAFRLSTRTPLQT